MLVHPDRLKGVQSPYFDWVTAVKEDWAEILRRPQEDEERKARDEGGSRDEGGRGAAGDGGHGWILLCGAGRNGGARVMPARVGRQVAGTRALRVRRRP